VKFEHILCISESKKKALGLLALGEEFFAESIFSFALSSPRVFFFVENIIFYSHQRDLRREHEIKLSAKNIALGEDSVSGSVGCCYGKERSGLG
jgi:hypothetical protein